MQDKSVLASIPRTENNAWTGVESRCAERRPEDVAGIMENTGIKAQARSGFRVASGRIPQHPKAAYEPKGDESLALCRWWWSRTASAPTTSIRACSKNVIFCGSVEDQRQPDRAQLLFLESENPDKDVHLYINSPWRSVNRRARDLRQCSLSATTCHHDVIGHGGEHGRCCWPGRKGQAMPAAFADHDPPAAGRIPGQATRHRFTPGRFC